MGLEDFEKELAASKESAREPKKPQRRHRDETRDERRHHRHGHHHHHHRSHGHRDDSRDAERRRSHKRRRGREEAEESRHGGKRPRSESPQASKARERDAAADVKVFDSDEDEWMEKEAMTMPRDDHGLGAPAEGEPQSKVQRDAWMQEPSALDVDYVRSRRPKEPPGQFVSATHDHDFTVHVAEARQHVADLQRDLADEEGGAHSEKADGDEPAPHPVSYTFGDAGSSWRMTKLRAVYRQAEETGTSVDDVASARYGDLRDFDDAREEERELERRRMYGKEYVGLDKPSGELFQERKMKAGVRRREGHDLARPPESPRQGEPMPEEPAPNVTVPLDATALNKLKAQMMRAKLRNAPEAAQLEAEYERAAQASRALQSQPDVVVLSNMENRQLAGGRAGEVTAVSGKRGRERGLVTENEDMSIDDMVRQEKRTRGLPGGEGQAFAARIAKDSKFENDLDYMDDNAAQLAKKLARSDVNLRNTAIGDFQKMQRILDSCPLCHHEDRAGADQYPTAPVVSLATRTYLTLATEPEVARGGAVVVPIQHRRNLLECDDDEWEELRNFMKALTRHYAAQDQAVIFYENAAHMHTRQGHAALVAVPLPHHLADTAPAYFREAILAAAGDWTQHRPVIDTLALSQRPGYGRLAFRKALAKEMPYFHVFFTLDGGLGHVIEDERAWPKGDLFAREVVGGMLDRGPETVQKQGRWERHDRRVEGFRKKWSPWDWTQALMDAP